MNRLCGRAGPRPAGGRSRNLPRHLAASCPGSSDLFCSSDFPFHRLHSSYYTPGGCSPLPMVETISQGPKSARSRNSAPASAGRIADQAWRSRQIPRALYFVVLALGAAGAFCAGSGADGMTCAAGTTTGSGGKSSQRSNIIPLASPMMSVPAPTTNNDHR